VQTAVNGGSELLIFVLQAAHSDELSLSSVWSQGSLCRTDADVGDRNYLVLAKPNVIMNDIRLGGLGVAGSDAAGRKSPQNQAQTARKLRGSLQKAAAVSSTGSGPPF
jgi:hypothetical protein